MAKEKEEQPKLGKTPTGKVVAETPSYSAPGAPRQFMGVYGEWLGDPDRRYGRLTSSRNIPSHTKIEMLGDPIIGLCQAYVSSMLVQANRVIECADEEKRNFFDAMFRAWEREFYLQASMAVAMGSYGLIKKFAFQRPEPKDLDAPPVWMATADPLIITGFDQVYPVGSSPKFDNKNVHFQGMTTPDGEIDVYYSLWVTIGKVMAFGSYYGFGRLRFCYRDWWMKHFGRDLYLVHLQKSIDRIAQVSYPPGKTSDGRDHQEIALSTGDSARAGATIAMPSNVWSQIDQISGEEKLTTVRKWALEFLQGSSATHQFHEVDDHHDSKMALGYLVPPQMFMYVRQSSLGGPTTADVLTDLAESLLVMNADEIDTHLNKYVFPVIDRANYPAGSPPVTVRTIGLEPGKKSELKAVLDKLMTKSNFDVAAHFDIDEFVRRVGYPQPTTTVVEWEPGEEGPGSDEEPEEGLTAAAEELSDEERERLEKIATAMLPPIGSQEAEVSDADRRQAWRRMHQWLPELFEDEEADA
jgi:hypothetical protein